MQILYPKIHPGLPTDGVNQWNLGININAFELLEITNNPRIGMMYTVWHKMQIEQKEALLKRAEWCITHLDEL